MDPAYSGPTFASDAGEGSANYACREDQQHGYNGVSQPFRAAFVGIDINVRHTNGGFLVLRW